MTPHQALQVIWGLAGLAILWWGMLAVSVSGLIAAMVWRSCQRSPAHEQPPPPPGRSAFGQASMQCGVLDVAAEADVVLQGLQNLATQQLVRLEMAVQPSLAVRADQRAFQEILEELARSAIEQSPCGCVLLTATRVGRRVHASVSDDGPRTDAAVRLARLRVTERIVALQDGSMEINARAGEGTTVTVRLPDSDPVSPRTDFRNESQADNIAR